MGCEISAGIRFAILGRVFKKRLDEAGRQKDLTGVQLMVLSQLHKLEQAGKSDIRQRDLENEAHLGHPTMTELLKKLEKKGFVKCRVCQADRRSKLISSTEKAQFLHGELENVDRQVFDELCCGLSDKQRTELIETLDLMLKNAFEELGKEVC